MSSAAATTGERRAEAGLRPTRLADVVGQRPAVELLTRLVEGARSRGELTIPHVCLVGGPGLGKTTIAYCLSNELAEIARSRGRSAGAGRSRPRGTLIELMGPNLRTARDLTWPLATVRPGTVVVVDEIHRLYRPVAEIMYTILEDGRMDVGDRLSPQMMVLPPITVVGATTDPERLTGPLLDRMVLVRLVPLTADELVAVALRAARVLGVDIDDEAADLVTQEAHGTPRMAIRLVRLAREWAVDHRGVSGGGRLITAEAVEAVLDNEALILRMRGRSAAGR